MRVALAFLILVSAFGQEPSSRNPVGTGVNDPVVDYYDSMADYFRNTQRAIAAINKKGVPDEEIAAVLLIARKSSASPNQVIEARKAGKSFADIAKANGVTLAGDDFVKEANIAFLSDYHSRPAQQIRELNSKGASFVSINQEFRRSGNSSMPKNTERTRKSN